jgi:hypothetical protein
MVFILSISLGLPYYWVKTSCNLSLWNLSFELQLYLFGNGSILQFFTGKSSEAFNVDFPVVVEPSR